LWITFPSFTELGQLPNWYENRINARRARCVSCRCKSLAERLGILRSLGV
jgi:hypothetical protein